MTETLKLSEAMRLGAMLRPQAFGQYVNADGSCAIGAACEAGGYESVFCSPWLVAVLSQPAICPECAINLTGFTRRPTGSVIVHLNDVHRWTREQIADWVATQEALVEPVAEPVAQQAGGAR